MKMIFLLGWRNIWRNKRRSIITISAVVFACFLTIAFKGINDGTYGVNIKMAAEMFTGYLQVQKKGYQENPTLSKTFKYQDIKSKLENFKQLKAFSPRVMADGLIAFKDNTSGTAIIGIDPQTENKASVIHKKLYSGQYLHNSRKYDLVMGYKLLKNLKANIGDTVVILSSCYDGSMGNLKFRISGTTKFGSPEMDAMSIIMTISAAQELLALDGRVSSIVISLDDFKKIDEVKSGLKNIVPETLTVLDWGEVYPELKQMMEMDSSNNAIFYIILIIIVAFGILNTVLMSITERFREFGVMLAIGVKNLRLVMTVFWETVYLTFIGILFGNLLGYLTNIYIINNPIKLSGQLAQMYEEFGFIPEIMSDVDLMIFIGTDITILIIAFIVFLYPAYRLLKLEALKGIRYT